MSVLSMRGVRRGFGRVEALRGVDLEVTGPGVLALIGRNGAGKSTLLRMVPALLHPDEGEVRVFGLDPWKDEEAVKRRLGYLAEEDRVPPLPRVRDLTELHASFYPGWDGELERSLLGRLGIDRGRRFGQLSKGQRRLVSLLCAVGHRPELLVLDEPASGLDAVVRREFLAVVVELLADRGSSVVLSTHNFADVERVADEVAILHEGRLIARERLDRLRERSCRISVGAPAGIEGTRRDLEGLPGAIRVVPAPGGFLVTFRATPEEAVLRARGLGLEVGAATPIGLEDLFIDWTGGRG